MPLIDGLAGAIDAICPGSRVRIAVDGPDAAGKTTLARGIATKVQRPVITASIDDWHHPRTTRVRRGELSPEGYYRDCFDVAALCEELLDPFATGASPVRIARFDHRTDREVRVEAPAPADAALIVDGVFLLRPELRARWDLAVYLDVPEAVTLARATSRDVTLGSSKDAVAARYAARYLPGQALYRSEAHPMETAHVVVDNTEPGEPLVLKWDLPGPT